MPDKTIRDVRWEVRNAAGETVYTYYSEVSARQVFENSGYGWMLLPGDYLVKVTQSTTTTMTYEEIDV